MFIKINKLQKWPKEDFALVTRPGGYPYFGRREVFRTRESNLQSWDHDTSCSSVHGKAFLVLICVCILPCRVCLTLVSRRFFCPPVWHLCWVVVCSSKPYVNKLILRSSRPSTSLYALKIKAITFLHTKCFIKTEFTRVHSQHVCIMFKLEPDNIKCAGPPYLVKRTDWPALTIVPPCLRGGT